MSVWVYPAAAGCEPDTPLRHGLELNAWPVEERQRFLRIRGEQEALRLPRPCALIAAPRHALVLAPLMALGLTQSHILSEIARVRTQRRHAATEISHALAVAGTDRVFTYAPVTGGDASGLAAALQSALSGYASIVCDLRFLPPPVFSATLTALSRVMGERRVLLIVQENFVVDCVAGLNQGRYPALMSEDGHYHRRCSGEITIQKFRTEGVDRERRRERFERWAARLIGGQDVSEPYHARERFIAAAKSLPSDRAPIDRGPFASALSFHAGRHDDVRGLTDLRGAVAFGMECEPGGGWGVGRVLRFSVCVQSDGGASSLAIVFKTPSESHPGRAAAIVTRVLSGETRTTTIRLGAGEQSSIVFASLPILAPRDVVDVLVRTNFTLSPNADRDDQRPLTIRIESVFVAPVALGENLAALDALRTAPQCVLLDAVRDDPPIKIAAVASDPNEANMAFVVAEDDRAEVRGLRLQDNTVTLFESETARERIFLPSTTLTLDAVGAHFVSEMIETNVVQTARLAAAGVSRRSIDAYTDACAQWGLIGFHPYAAGQLLLTQAPVCYIMGRLRRPITSKQKATLTLDIHAIVGDAAAAGSSIEVWAGGVMIARSALVDASGARLESFVAQFGAVTSFILRIAHPPRRPIDFGGVDPRELGVAFAPPVLAFAATEAIQSEADA